MSAYFSGSLIEDYGVPFVFGLTAVFPLMTMGAALLIQEKRVSKNDVSSYPPSLTMCDTVTTPAIFYASVDMSPHRSR